MFATGNSPVPAAMEESWIAAVSLTRRMPPKLIDRTVAGVQHLCPDLSIQLLTRVDRRLRLCFDSEARKFFIACIYNQHGSSFRSPWTNAYIEGNDVSVLGAVPQRRIKPADNLRNLETTYNRIFDSYRRAYYEGGVSSVYLWSLPSEDGFAGAFLVRHALDGGVSGDGPRGCWESVHVVEVTQSTSNVHYRLTSTVMVDVDPPENAEANFYAGAMLTRTSEQSQKVTDLLTGPEVPPHIGVIGPMIEAMEDRMRTAIERNYFAKAYSILDGMIRTRHNTKEPKKAAFFSELSSSLSLLSRGSGGGPGSPGGRSVRGSRSFLRPRSGSDN
ncbi:F-actin-capping protein subunit beta, putative [Toxoplasma gondii ME49]|uniref:F-actin-capping protein subunit beta n=1 Tax=Toxoplasma gondii (strain ATCC 50611 / Me49) TaxID=508771 RepID=S8EN02_TOXGM|nr:F-actin-capping protein subunit beta, putative [Toxoplasma gondii ME49]EPT24616.1 F-actin-capping protein subunit beta, putative [Toxoplasma gondii ME49]|eukprot:XP_002370693.1 F-actin-capping protein subunit beta, putative [Toxoplasma gondii ME49]